jgi:hypothetical protein
MSYILPVVVCNLRRDARVVPAVMCVISFVAVIRSDIGLSHCSRYTMF